MEIKTRSKDIRQSPGLLFQSLPPSRRKKHLLVVRHLGNCKNTGRCRSRPFFKGESYDQKENTGKYVVVDF
jgi:hypothetical protein